MDKYITIEEAAKRLGKSVEDVRAMMNAGKLRGVMAAGTFKFKEADVAALEQPAAANAKEDTLMTIDSDVLFAEGEGQQPADAAAETWIAADMENVFESEDFKPGAAGKGEAALRAKDLEPSPLPLSPEKDDTALGTVLMEGEAGAGEAAGEEPVIAIDPESGIATITAPTPGISRTHMIVVSEPEPRHKTFTPLMVVSFIAAGFALASVWAGLLNAPAAYVKTVDQNLPFFMGVLAAAAVIGAIVGYILDRQKAAGQPVTGRMGR